MDIKVIGIDLAKNVFQVCVFLMDNSVISNKNINRNKLLDKIRQFNEGSLCSDPVIVDTLLSTNF